MKFKSQLLILSIIGATTMSCKDSSKPFIELNGSHNHTISLNTAYVEPGAIATDDKDGDISSAIVITGTVNANQKGEYHLYYNVADESGNDAPIAIRNVNVINDADYLEGFYIATPNCGATSQTNYSSTVSSSETQNNKIFIDQLETGTSIITSAFVNNNVITLSNQGFIGNWQYSGTGVTLPNGFALNTTYNSISNYSFNCETIFAKQ
jgi:hypothetical protein